MTLKTRPSDASVADFLAAVEHPTRRADALVLLALFERITGEAAVLWGETIVGFGGYDYQRQGETLQWMQTGFSPRKQNLSIYVMNGFSDYTAQLAKLGKHKTSVSCLYINKLADVDLTVLEAILADSWAKMRAGQRIC
ncbi:DUF1801 domain-containing protein [Simiduia aestuariiviva]|uniref:YdhG-like domain-containing protein n=1 Tax=Simiduia aestuariiviva TaxID=1510459 RepID=A0A839UQI1_9GAMM|nr:hypothetical protein [Simiduia aestuariiviva]